MIRRLLATLPATGRGATIGSAAGTRAGRLTRRAPLATAHGDVRARTSSTSAAQYDASSSAGDAPAPPPHASATTHASTPVGGARKLTRSEGKRLARFSVYRSRLLGTDVPPPTPAVNTTLATIYEMDAFLRRVVPAVPSAGKPGAAQDAAEAARWGRGRTGRKDDRRRRAREADQLIERLEGGGLALEALTIYSAAVSSELVHPLDGASYVHAVALAYNVEGADGALQVLEDAMEARKSTADCAAVTGAFVDQALRRGGTHVHTALGVCVDFMRSTGAAPSEAVLQALSSHIALADRDVRRSPETADLLHEMRMRGVAPTTSLFHSLLRLALEDGDAERAAELVEHAVTAGHSPTQAMLLCAFMSARRAAAAEWASASALEAQQHGSETGEAAHGGVHGDDAAHGLAAEVARAAAALDASDGSADDAADDDSGDPPFEGVQGGAASSSALDYSAPTSVAVRSAVRARDAAASVDVHAKGRALHALLQLFAESGHMSLLDAEVLAMEARGDAVPPAVYALVLQWYRAVAEGTAGAGAGAGGGDRSAARERAQQVQETMRELGLAEHGAPRGSAPETPLSAAARLATKEAPVRAPTSHPEATLAQRLVSDYIDAGAVDRAVEEAEAAMLGRGFSEPLFGLLLRAYALQVTSSDDGSGGSGGDDVADAVVATRGAEAARRAEAVLLRVANANASAAAAAGDDSAATSAPAPTPAMVDTVLALSGRLSRRGAEAAAALRRLQAAGCPIGGSSYAALIMGLLRRPLDASGDGATADSVDVVPFPQSWLDKHWGRAAAAAAREAAAADAATAVAAVAVASKGATTAGSTAGGGGGGDAATRASLASDLYLEAVTRSPPLEMGTPAEAIALCSVLLEVAEARADGKLALQLAQDLLALQARGDIVTHAHHVLVRAAAASGDLQLSWQVLSGMAKARVAAPLDVINDMVDACAQRAEAAAEAVVEASANVGAAAARAKKPAAAEAVEGAAAAEMAMRVIGLSEESGVSADAVTFAHALRALALAEQGFTAAQLLGMLAPQALGTNPWPSREVGAAAFEEACGAGLEAAMSSAGAELPDSAGDEVSDASVTAGVSRARHHREATKATSAATATPLFALQVLRGWGGARTREDPDAAIAGALAVLLRSSGARLAWTQWNHMRRVGAPVRAHTWDAAAQAFSLVPGAHEAVAMLAQDMVLASQARLGATDSDAGALTRPGALAATVVAGAYLGEGQPRAAAAVMLCAGDGAFAVAAGGGDAKGSDDTGARDDVADGVSVRRQGRAMWGRIAEALREGGEGGLAAHADVRARG